MWNTNSGHLSLLCGILWTKIGAAFKDTVESFFISLRSHVKTKYHALWIPCEQGAYKQHNSINIIQTRDYVKIGWESYIDRMMMTHGWDSPSRKDSPRSTPITSNVANCLMLLKSPPKKSSEAKQIAIKAGFSYCNVLGGLIYAYVISCLDIGFSVCFLARFANRPQVEHFTALKCVCKYLCEESSSYM
jgi:hypothetical protein